MAKDGMFTIRIPLSLARQLQAQADESPWGVTITAYVTHHLRRLARDRYTRAWDKDSANQNEGLPTQLPASTGDPPCSPTLVPPEVVQFSSASSSPQSIDTSAVKGCEARAEPVYPCYCDERLAKVCRENPDAQPSYCRVRVRDDGPV